MFGAVLEFEDGSTQYVRHKDGVASVSIGREKRKVRVKVTFGDGSVERHYGAISGRLVDEFWWHRTQLGLPV